MGLDKANIFKLPKDEFAKYKQDPFLDCFNSTKEFATALKYDIETKETPHSLLLSATYGMGKTFFSTRFTQFLRNNRYDVIYFSVWEYDYMQEPFLAFSKALVNYIHNKFQAEKYKSNIDKLFDKTEKIAGAVTFKAGIPGLEASISAKDLIEAFKAKNDPVVEFRKQLTAFIKKLPKKKLIIIIDELDRCRPDYAMKTLECIKHFFDIEGLFIILPTNKSALNDCVKALYGIDNCTSDNEENYFQKFFNDERILKNPTEADYLYIIKQYLSKNRLKEAIDKKLLSDNLEDYNSLNNLQVCFAKYSYKAKLTVREIKDYSLELARICNNFYEPIRTEWLACVFANKKNKGKNFSYPLPKAHCFYYSQYPTCSNGKDDILQLNDYKSVFRTLKNLTSGYFEYNYEVYNKYCLLINEAKKLPSTSSLYSDIEQFFDVITNKIEAFQERYSLSAIVIKNLSCILDAIKTQKLIISEYQKKYGSDDEDSNRSNRYIEIVQSPGSLYSDHN